MEDLSLESGSKGFKRFRQGGVVLLVRALPRAKYEQHRCGGVSQQDVWHESYDSGEEYSAVSGCGVDLDCGGGGSAEGA